MVRLRFHSLRKNDIKSCVSIVKANYSIGYAKLAENELKEMFGKALLRPAYIVAKQGKETVGFAGFIQAWMDYHVYSIFWVNVKSERQKQGIGKKLVAKIIGYVRKKKEAHYIVLTTKSPNYYSKHFGFVKLTICSGVDGKKSWLMGLRIR